jgi:flagellar biosynthetic protein FlhB
MVIWILPMIFKSSTMNLKLLIEHSGEIRIDQGQVWNVTYSSITKAFLSLSPLFIMVITAVIFAAFVQQGQISFSANSIEPKLSKISIFKGIGRIFSTNNFVEFLKSIAKVTLVGIFLYLIINSDIQELRVYQDMSIGLILSQFHSIISDVMICVTVTTIVIAVIDYSYQHYEYYQSMRMTKQELKDEHKQVEGDPLIKGRIRELRMARVRNNLMKNVPKADVIITNPTHYAIGLEYNTSMSAPKVVVKGMDLIALKIREIADEQDIPIVEDPPLARALYHKLEISDYVPEEHFEAVAKIIGYVYSLKEKKKNND